MLEILALFLAGVHFGAPLIYYWYMKSKYLERPWNLKLDNNYRPKVTVILPIYNEAEFIEAKLDNLYAQNYPKDLMEVIVVDSASNDGTHELVEEWVSRYKNVDIRLLREKERRGKLSAILKSLNYISLESDIVVFTDADAFWESNALTKIVRYFADPKVGAVTSNIVYSENETFENVYRAYYNIIRIAESKVHSTPIHNGPFLAVRAELMRKFGLPMFPGSDDSSFGSYIAFLGFRALQVDDIIVKEPMKGSQLYRKIRRAQHLLLSFLKTKQYVKKLGAYKYVQSFEKIWKVEWWLHMANPWLLIGSIVLSIVGTFSGSLLSLTILGIGLTLLILKIYRMWVSQQFYLIIAMIRNLWTKQIVWKD